MTVSDIVEKIVDSYQGKSIDMKVLQRFLSDSKIRVSQETQIQLLDNYNRRVIDMHMKRGKDMFTEAHSSYVEARKKLDLIIAGFSAKLAMEDVVELKQQVNNTINSAILWSKK
jgi:predicted CopG family antitoxin